MFFSCKFIENKLQLELLSKSRYYNVFPAIPCITFVSFVILTKSYFLKAFKIKTLNSEKRKQFSVKNRKKELFISASKRHI